MEALGLDGFTKPLARNCAWVGRDGATVSLTLDARLKHLLQEPRRAVIEQALSAQMGEAISLRIEIASAPVADTPVELDKQRATDRQRAAEAAIDADPVVRAFKDMFGATVRPGSVQPLDS